MQVPFPGAGFWRANRQAQRQTFFSNTGLVFFFALLCSIFAVVGCHGALTSQQEEGKVLYRSNCVVCHEGSARTSKKDVPPDLHHIFNKATLPSGDPATDKGVYRVVFYGRGPMPAFDSFTQEQMDALLSYLHTGLR
jgi:hypothetical protein